MRTLPHYGHGSVGRMQEGPHASASGLRPFSDAFYWRHEMKLLLTFSLGAAAAGQAPGVDEIMARVAHNQTRSAEARKQYTYHQKQLLRFNRGNGKIAREERREYDVTPAPRGFLKELAHFEGKYEYKGKYFP